MYVNFVFLYVHCVHTELIKYINKDLNQTQLYSICSCITETAAVICELLLIVTFHASICVYLLYVLRSDDKQKAGHTVILGVITNDTNRA